MADKKVLNNKELEVVAGGVFNTNGVTYIGYAKRKSAADWEKRTEEYENLESTINAAYWVAVDLRNKTFADDVVYWVDMFEGISFVRTAFEPKEVGPVVSDV